MQDDALLARIKKLRSMGASDEEVAAFVDEHDRAKPDFSDVQSGSSSVAPEPSVFEKMGVQDPTEGMRAFGQSKAAKLAAGLGSGFGAGALTARALAGATGRGLLGKMGVGATSSAVGGATARGVMEDGGAVDRAGAALNPAGLGIDVALGAGIPAVGEVVRKGVQWWGHAPKTTAAEKADRLLREVARRRGGTPEQTATDLRGAAGRPIAVADLDPQFRQLSVDAAHASPIAERQLQQFAEGRAGAPTAGAIDDVSQALGRRPKDTQVLTAKLKEQLAKADKERFGAVWRAYPKPISNRNVLMQWNAITQEVPSSLRGLVSEQVVALKPVREVVRKIRGTDFTAPTLKGVHRVKVMLDKAIKAGERAEKSGTLTSDQAFHLGSLKTARDQLKSFAFRGVEGGQEYKSVLAASAAKRKEIAALQRGVKAMRPSADPLKPEGITPERMRRELLELSQQEPVTWPGAKGPTKARNVRVGNAGGPSRVPDAPPDVVDADWTMETAGTPLAGPAQPRLPDTPRRLPGRPRLPSGEQAAGALPPGGLPPVDDVGAISGTPHPARLVRDRRIDLYKTGALGTIAERAANQSEESGSFIKDMLEKPALREKIRMVAGANADDLMARLRDRLAVSETNKAQMGSGASTRPIDPTARTAISGTFGEAGAVGSAIGGELGQTKQSALLALGSLLRKGANRRIGAAEQKAFERLVPFLTKDVGPQAADEYEQIIKLLGELNRRRTLGYGLAGAAAGTGTERP